MSRNFFARCLTGEAPLWQAFWLGAVAGTTIVIVAFVQLASVLSASTIGPVLSRPFLVGILLGYAVFSSVSVWQCARNPKGSPLHALARVYAVLSMAVWVLLAVTALLWR